MREGNNMGIHWKSFLSGAITVLLFASPNRVIESGASMWASTYRNLRETFLAPPVPVKQEFVTPLGYGDGFDPAERKGVGD